MLRQCEVFSTGVGGGIWLGFMIAAWVWAGCAESRSFGGHDVPVTCPLATENKIHIG
jgi:hypothetical protein